METLDTNLKDLEEKAEILKALGHPVRLCIVRGLLQTGGCNVSKIQGCLEIPQSTISQHIAKLKSAGIIVGDRKGLEITYKVANEQVLKIMHILFNL
ncbi:MAG: helix-turn-helix transcriptional regulator [Clostridiaceae bacterium]|nr:helix-turn-helix transcriptional regulator [Clostridiaceae bacterium]